MFSLDRFYKILHGNLIEPLNGHSISFYPFGTYDNMALRHQRIDSNDLVNDDPNWAHRDYFHCYFFDQEPFYNFTFDKFEYYRYSGKNRHYPNQINIIANSEHSELLNNFLKNENIYNWYYFFHGFVALDWYRDFRYFHNNSFDQFTKVFISYNNLISKYRSYRLHLASEILSRNLQVYGRMSIPLQEGEISWKHIVTDKNSLLTFSARSKIFNIFSNLKTAMIIDDVDSNGTNSANIILDDLVSALWHVVTETVYFQDKLHLTEKVFKPIIAKRPFLLAGAKGNLEYLKSYGFETFDQWIDESYDQETDNYLRIIKIVDQLERLCNMSLSDLKDMHNEMKPVLEYNFNHFYTGFREKITYELVDNFEHILCQINNGRQPGNHSRYHRRFELPKEYFANVKRILLQ